MIALNKDDTAYLDKVLERLKTYKKPKSHHELLILLSEKTDKSDDDFTKLKALLSAEKKADELFEAKKKVDNLIKAEKDAERRLLEHKKYLLGGAVWAGLRENKKVNENLTFRQLLQILVNQGSFTDEGKTHFNEFLNPVSAPAPSPVSAPAPTPQNEPSKLQQLQNRQNQN